ILAPVLRKTWFYEAAAQRVGMGTTTRKQLIESLAYTAGATADHTGHIESLIEWLMYAGLLTINGDKVTVIVDAADVVEEVATPPAPEKSTQVDTGTGQVATETKRDVGR